MKNAMMIAVFLLLNILPVYAQSKYDLKTITPEVQAALDGRRSRFEELRTLKASGKIGENNSGYVEALGGDSQAASLAQQENADRRLIYEAVVAQNGLPAGSLRTIEGVFAQVQRDKAAAGDKIQLEDGTWTTK